ncbi:MAG: hypothetical protein AABW50_01805 [Nanoarchaeota archaeon]
MRSGSKLIMLLIFLIFAVYQINVAFNFVKLSGFFEDINKWIVFVGGILLAFGGFSHYRLKTMQGF